MGEEKSGVSDSGYRAELTAPEIRASPFL
jgi:hypothetical protein